jgi:hypothetical protein
MQRPHGWLCIGALVLAACSGRMEPARRSIADIETVVSAAAPDAGTYAARELRGVQDRVNALEAAFAAHDYESVERDAPAVMKAAQGLAATAAADKAEALRVLGGRWTLLAGKVPDAITALQRRVEMLARRSGPGRPAVPDVGAARAALGRAESQWSKAQAAFATGNMAEAVATATSLEAQLDDLAGTLTTGARD